MSVGSTAYPAGADFTDPNGNPVDVLGVSPPRPMHLDNSITTLSVNTIAIDDIVNIAEDGAVAISLSGVDADVVTNVQVTAASNIDTLTGLAD